MPEDLDGHREEGHHAHGQQRHRGIEVPHHREHGDQGDAGLEQRQQRAVDEDLKAVSVPGDAGDRVSDGSAAMKQEGQPLEVGEQVGA